MTTTHGALRVPNARQRAIQQMRRLLPPAAPCSCSAFIDGGTIAQLMIAVDEHMQFAPVRPPPRWLSLACSALCERQLVTKDARREAQRSHRGIPASGFRPNRQHGAHLDYIQMLSTMWAPSVHPVSTPCAVQHRSPGGWTIQKALVCGTRPTHSPAPPAPRRAHLARAVPPRPDRALVHGITSFQDERSGRHVLLLSQIAVQRMSRRALCIRGRRRADRHGLQRYAPMSTPHAPY
ncbi:hypothetical protein HYPSUDRAFT_208770 [Hypholoma sublateritium FD-334 SS-4]|uniref:Uncharacterized protein n=1 Tax=Hypholoma sublateritium (strain FD-334 SS-4) TaxID=945553 RepID=A0A0D2N5B1_HYPSF|nr:hypothetical protein HYPSUDRAFT_208770 [Hypholoma sublateritium FD-334 SS-4]